MDPKKTESMLRENARLRERLERRWITVREAAEHLSVSTSLMYNLLANGDVKGAKIGDKAVRVDRLSLERYVEARDYQRIKLRRNSVLSRLRSRFNGAR